MGALSAYLLISTVLLGWVTSNWSGSGFFNIIIKFAFVAATVFGAIMTARSFPL